MANVKTTKKYAPKKKFYRRKGKYSNVLSTVAVPRVYPNGFPDTMVQRMRYSSNVRLTPAAAASVASHLYVCNGIFDPDYSGTGHQPYGHDIMQSIYKNYMVLASHIRVTATPTSTGVTTGPGVIGVAIIPDTGVITGFRTIRESVNSKWVVVTNETPAYVTQGWNSKKAFQNVSSGETSAAFGSQPSNRQFFQVYATHLNQNTYGGSWDCVIDITYIVKCWEREKIPES